MQSSPPTRLESGWRRWIPFLLLAAAVAVLFLTSPYRSDIWWSDASRHAMDGAFYRDFFRHMPLGHLRQFATNYYIKYPLLPASVPDG